MMNFKSDMILQIPIVGKFGETVFSSGKYIIPLYQRAFSWKEKEITQLIDDIDSIDSDKAGHYYLGSLIVNQCNDGAFEVIDGQQRLTALFLLLDYLGCVFDRSSLTFECREKSDYTLRNLSKLCDKKNDLIRNANTEKIDWELFCGRKIIEDKFNGDKLDRQNFMEKLNNVLLFRIEVPPHTDLNRYFEIMNVRGEQLEQHDIVKAEMMKAFSETERNERDTFALVWDACRDMTGYVQMHFPNREREILFGSKWDELDPSRLFALKDGNSEAEEENVADGKSVLDIISNIDRSYQVDEEKPKKDRVRFESIIDFPHFLLHVLKVFVSNDQNISESIPELLDDKKLSEVFKAVLEKCPDQKIFAKEFVRCLLKCRFLFDKFIIKREYKNEDSEGEWSLKTLGVFDKRTYKAPNYSNDTCFEKDPEQCSYHPRTRRNLMLQACLRVSYTSPKNMHWITELLNWLYQDENRNDLSKFEEKTKEVILEPVSKFLNAGDYRLGVGTPHIVFNCLDCLLWERDEESDFTFEYRTSVEHWYPQHPSEQSFSKWDEVDRFGNLCIVRRDVNSKFSNLSPMSKKETYKELVKNGSLKLRLMSEATITDASWRDKSCAEHENEMLDLLREACRKE